MSIAVGHIIDFDLGVKDLGIIVGREVQTIESSGQAEYSIDNLIEREIGPQQLIIDLVQAVALFVGIVTVVPSLQFKIFALSLCGKLCQSI